MSLEKLLRLTHHLPAADKEEYQYRGKTWPRLSGVDMPKDELFRKS